VQYYGWFLFSRVLFRQRTSQFDILIDKTKHIMSAINYFLNDEAVPMR